MEHPLQARFSAKHQAALALRSIRPSGAAGLQRRVHLWTAHTWQAFSGCLGRTKDSADCFGLLENIFPKQRTFQLGHKNGHAGRAGVMSIGLTPPCAPADDRRDTGAAASGPWGAA